MDKDQLVNQDALRTRILGFLADHFEHCFTVEELASEQAISGSVDEIQDRIEVMLRDRLVKIKETNGKRCFQALLAGRRRFGG